MTKFSATHNGKTFTRNSKRTFTHVVIAEFECDGFEPCAHSWAGSKELADKAAAAIKTARNVSVVEVTAA